MNILALSILYLIPIVFFIVSYNKRPWLAWIIILAYFLRLIFLGIHLFIFPLPESQSDAIVFENFAWELAQGGKQYILDNFKGFDSYFISWMYSWFYLILGREILILHGINIVIGVANVILCWKVSKILFGKSPSYAAALFCAIYPTFLIYSVITLREVFVPFGLLIGVLGILKWYESMRIYHLITVFFGFALATLFHGAMIVGLVAFLLCLGAQLFYYFKYALSSGYLHYRWVLIGIGGVIFILLFSPQLSNIPKIGSIFNDSSIEAAFYILNVVLDQNIQGSAAYPPWLTISSMSDIFIIGPIRIIYFLFGPFPWNISSGSLLIGFFDGLMHLFFVVGIIKNFSSENSNKSAYFAICIILVGYFLVFGLAVQNFGTGFRHRNKLLPLLAAFYFGTRKKKTLTISPSK